MTTALKRGFANGLILSFWVVAFLLAPKLGVWLHWQLYPYVTFNWK